jgi:GrpB-like predicted nucleotidyltransferase (UPF0157 family)
MFRELALHMRSALGAVAIRIDHIGSTAVPGLAAKPIIDIQISVAAFDPIEPFLHPLEALGYRYRADNPELTKRYFREPKSSAERTHIHVRRAGSFSEQFPLLFRDFLRNHPDDALEFVRLKRRLAAQFQDDRHRYAESKDDFIWNTMRKADRWAQNTGWDSGASDA